MKLHIDELSQERTISLSGGEPWLKEIYETFPHPASEPKPTLSGEFHLLQEDAGTVKVDGHIDYSPFIPCTRCSQPIPWHIKENIDTRFLPADWQPHKKEHKLSRSELDDYFLNNGWVDLEELINDLVQTSIPSSTVKTEENSSICSSCQETGTGDLLYGPGPSLGASGAEGTDEDKPHNPFAVLKGLKLDD